MADPHTRETDVVVLGGGLAGLAAARELVAAGTSVAVLEARERAAWALENRWDGPVV
jgi:monoamine oxidase